MDTVDYTLGTSGLTGDYEVGYDGLPDQISYYLDYINYELKTDFYKKFKPIYTRKKDDIGVERKNKFADGVDLKLFKEAASKRGTTSWIILDELSCPLHSLLSKTEEFAMMYLVYKVLNIAATYPHYL